MLHLSALYLCKLIVILNINTLIVSSSADSVGTETLKNLVLPGVGSFTILDDFIVDQHDLGETDRPPFLKNHHHYLHSHS